MINFGSLMKTLAQGRKAQKQELKSFSFILIILMRLRRLLEIFLWLLENTFFIAPNIFLLLLLLDTRWKFRWTLWGGRGRKGKLSFALSSRAREQSTFSTFTTNALANPHSPSSACASFWWYRTLFILSTSTNKSEIWLFSLTLVPTEHEMIGSTQMKVERLRVALRKREKVH